MGAVWLAFGLKGGGSREGLNVGLIDTDRFSSGEFIQTGTSLVGGEDQTGSRFSLILGSLWGTGCACAELGPCGWGLSEGGLQLCFR